MKKISLISCFGLLIALGLLTSLSSFEKNNNQLAFLSSSSSSGTGSGSGSGSGTGSGQLFGKEKSTDCPKDYDIITTTKEIVKSKNQYAFSGQFYRYLGSIIIKGETWHQWEKTTEQRIATTKITCLSGFGFCFERACGIK
ncbi:MAG: hypothetical protein QM768_13400 [Agriterribacter sp.]